MAVPKKKQSRSASRKRRSHDALPNVALTKCTNCGELILPHTLCGTCGYYKGQKELQIKAAKQA